MDFAIMFDVLEGGVIEPIEWSKDAFTPDRSIIVLDEGTTSLFLWHGAKQGLVARRTALRQAESLKGHGYTVGKSIIGRDTKEIKEIDSRKVGRVPEETDLDKELQNLLSKEFRATGDFMVTFQVGEFESTKAEKKAAAALKPKPEPKPAPKIEPKPQPKPEPRPAPKVEPKPQPKPAPTPAAAPKPKPSTPTPATTTAPSAKPEIKFASEYDNAEPLPSVISESASAPAPAAAPADKPGKTIDTKSEAKVGFVIIGVLSQYDDIWISKKADGAYSIEMMDGPVCEFSITDGSLKFTSNSFTSLPANIKTDVQNKFIELSNLLK